MYISFSEKIVERKIEKKIEEEEKTIEKEEKVLERKENEIERVEKKIEDIERMPRRGDFSSYRNNDSN